MNDAILELGKLCKAASELERKWDRAGRDYMGTQISAAEYARSLELFLQSVRRLETALTTHLVVVTAESSHAREHRSPD